MLFGQVSGYCTRHGFRAPDMEDSDSHPAIALPESSPSAPSLAPGHKGKILPYALHREGATLVGTHGRSTQP
jgi:hypothetical protein